MADQGRARSDAQWAGHVVRSSFSWLSPAPPVPAASQAGPRNQTRQGLPWTVAEDEAPWHRTACAHRQTEGATPCYKTSISPVEERGLLVNKQAGQEGRFSPRQ